MNCCIVQNNNGSRARVWCTKRQYIEFNEILERLAIDGPLIDVAGNVSVHCESGKDSKILLFWARHFVPNDLSPFGPAMSPVGGPRIDPRLIQEDQLVRSPFSQLLQPPSA